MKRRQPSADAPPAAPDPLRRVPGEAPERGRGATFNPQNRYRREGREAYDDGWPVTPDESGVDEEPAPLKTTVTIQPARTIIARNASPDIPFTQSINPYQGCEHGCIYCYARPTHAFHDLSPGLDFETKLFAKPNAPALLRAELGKRGYACDPIALGTNTDPYQPIEREWKVTRGILEVLAETEHPFTIVTKSALVERDLDLIAPMAAKNMARVYISITTLDKELARSLEPRAATPPRRLQAVRALTDAGVPVGVLAAPGSATQRFRPRGDPEAAAARRSRRGMESLLRLPLEVAPLFRDWLDVHYPLRAEHVMSVLRQLRGGRDYDARFGQRMRGTGVFAELIEKRFALACKRLGLNRDRTPLDISRFRPPVPEGPRQLALL
jgi:DNA repair photolyase